MEVYFTECGKVHSFSCVWSGTLVSLAQLFQKFNISKSFSLYQNVAHILFLFHWNHWDFIVLVLPGFLQCQPLMLFCFLILRSLHFVARLVQHKKLVLVFAGVVVGGCLNCLVKRIIISLAISQTWWIWSDIVQLLFVNCLAKTSPPFIHSFL